MKYVAPKGAIDPNAPYLDKDPQTGTSGSVVQAAAVEHPLREIVAAIEAAGLTPDENQLNQLAQAIEQIVNNRVSNHETLTNNPHSVTAEQTLAVPLSGQAELIGGYESPPLDLGTVTGTNVTISLKARNHQLLTVTNENAIFTNPSDVNIWKGGEVRLWLTLGAAAKFVSVGANISEQTGSFVDMESGLTYLVHIIGKGDGYVYAYITEVS